MNGKWDSIQSAFWDAAPMDCLGRGKNLSVWNGGWMNLTDCDDGVRCAVLFLLYSNAVALCTSVLHRFVLVLCYCTTRYVYTVRMRNSTVRGISAFFLHCRVH